MNENTFPNYLIWDAIFGIVNVWAAFCVLAGLIGLVRLFRQWLKQSRAERWDSHYTMHGLPKADDYEYAELKAALFRQIDVILREMEEAED